MAAIFGVLDLFQPNLPASYIRAFLAVAKDPGRTVSDYARVCGVGNGPMSMRLNDLGETNRYHLPGYGLLESRPDPMDRRYTIVKLSLKGEAFARRIASAMQWRQGGSGGVIRGVELGRDCGLVGQSISLTRLTE